MLKNDKYLLALKLNCVVQCPTIPSKILSVVRKKNLFNQNDIKLPAEQFFTWKFIFNLIYDTILT